MTRQDLLLTVTMTATTIPRTTQTKHYELDGDDKECLPGILRTPTMTQMTLLMMRAMTVVIRTQHSEDARRSNFHVHSLFAAHVPMQPKAGGTLPPHESLSCRSGRGWPSTAAPPPPACWR